MRTISIRDDVEQVALQYVRALPDVFTQFDINRVELVEYLQDGDIYSADIVFVESDDYEVVLGSIVIGTDLILEVDVYSDENELILTSEQIID
jgi:hypothetical protein